VTRQQWMAGALLGLFLSVFSLVLSETLHRALHEDACQPEHQCAVTMLQSGQVDAPVCDAAIVSPEFVSVLVQLVENTFVPAVTFFLPPSCGPPALLS
jgi:hypothetical protein